MATKILVLGGNGFVGSHLVESLLAGGARVRVLDRSGSLKTPPMIGVDYRYADLADLPALTEALADMDLVIHLISTTVPGTANQDPIADIDGNLIGTVRLLQKLRNAGVPKLIYLSSGGTVYGDSPNRPIPETHPRDPLSSYGIVKAAIENYIAMYGGLAGFQFLILRVSNLYGPRQGHVGVQGVIPTICRRILDGEPLKIWGDGSATRDYLHISDLMTFITAAITQGATGTFNVGSGMGTSLTQLLELFAQITRKPLKLEYLPPRGFDVRHLVLDITKARRTLGWQPQVPLREGCQGYWEWLQRHEG